MKVQILKTILLLQNIHVAIDVSETKIKAI